MVFPLKIEPSAGKTHTMNTRIFRNTHVKSHFGETESEIAAPYKVTHPHAEGILVSVQKIIGVLTMVGWLSWLAYHPMHQPEGLWV